MWCKCTIIREWKRYIKLWSWKIGPLYNVETGTNRTCEFGMTGSRAIFSSDCFKYYNLQGFWCVANINFTDFKKQILLTICWLYRWASLNWGRAATVRGSIFLETRNGRWLCFVYPHLENPSVALVTLLRKLKGLSDRSWYDMSYADFGSQHWDVETRQTCLLWRQAWIATRMCGRKRSVMWCALRRDVCRRGRLRLCMTRKFLLVLTPEEW